jgi:hypothetical protein
MSASAAAAAAVSQAASSVASQLPPASFTGLHNHTQPPVAVNPLAGMHSQSLTQPIALPASAAAHTQFTQYAEVQQRLTTACTEYSKAATALKGALASRERFVSSGSKQGSSKQLPAKLDWKLCKAAHLSSDGVPAGFYAADLTALRAIEHEATEKAFDALLAAKDKHIAHLQSRCVLRDFVTAAAADFLPHLQRIAAAYNKESQADPLAPSQSGFSFPTTLVASYFTNELQSRLTAQTLAKVQADSAEQQRVANDRAEEHKAQETVLTGASTGQTIAMVAERAVQQQLAPMQKQISQLLQQLQLQQQQPPRLHQHGRHQPRGSPQHPNASSFTPMRTYQHNPAPRNHTHPSTPKTSATKRARDSDDSDDVVIVQPSLTVSVDTDSSPAPKRHKQVTLTLKPKNGAGGDRHNPRVQPRPQSAQPADAPTRQQQKHHGRGPRSDAQQQQRQQ